MLRRAAPLALVLAAALAPATASAGSLDRDYAAYARNIIPSGQLGTVPVPGDADVQAKMYDALTPRFDSVSAGDLLTDFKSEGFGVGPDGPGEVEKGIPYKGVTITRDRYHVPHVRSKTYDGGIWAAGWIAAEDRGLLLAQARFNSRVAVIDAPGLDALGLISGLKTFVPSAQTEAVVARQTNVLKKAGKKGRKVLHDIDTFSAGRQRVLQEDQEHAAQVDAQRHLRARGPQGPVRRPGRRRRGAPDAVLLGPAGPPRRAGGRWPSSTTCASTTIPRCRPRSRRPTPTSGSRPSARAT